jgi:hypothetical protein
MNKNRFRNDGFSNPETQRLFEGWPEQECEANIESENLCGFCGHSRFLGGAEWVVCLNADSRYCYETLCSWFTCSRFEARLQPPEPGTPFEGPG